MNGELAAAMEQACERCGDRRWEHARGRRPPRACILAGCDCPGFVGPPLPDVTRGAAPDDREGRHR